MFEYPSLINNLLSIKKKNSYQNNGIEPYNLLEDYHYLMKNIWYFKKFMHLKIWAIIEYIKNMSCRGAFMNT